MITDLRYPIGKFISQPFSNELLIERLNDILNLPQLLEMAVANLDITQLNTPYREDGWMIKQVVHHIADSHINAYTRFKLGLTETNPSTIRPYDEVAWANLHDSLELPIKHSLLLISALHFRWHFLLNNLSENDFINKSIFHPANNNISTLWDLLGIYAWHGKHHVAHITNLKMQKKWK